MKGSDPLKNTFKTVDYDVAMAKPRPKRRKPVKPNIFWRTLIRILTIFNLAGTGVTYTRERMELIAKDEPCLILMNHSCFMDMPIAYQLLYPRPLNIVCSSDAFIGFWGFMGWLMYTIGCIPTQKFVTDVSLIKDMTYCLKEKKSSVLMYPEASYSFDGRATQLPRKMGVLLKKLDVPVIMIETKGAFNRNPLYNELQARKSVKASAHMRLLYTQEEVREKSVQELSDGLDEAFGFDNWAWQKENGVEIHDDFRADGLSRILWKCPHCGEEGKMDGRGIHLTCHHCGKKYELTPIGDLKALEGETEFTTVPQWNDWQRQQVRQSILDGSYKLDVDVDITMMVDFKALYNVGSGHLTHDLTGFHLTGCDGRLDYHQKPQSCYGLYADYYWYEVADMICVGNNDEMYYCFPKGGDVVAKTRMATEEMYKLYKSRQLKMPETIAL
jgi:1-acyl-sn-glycerol-3-phosphate acyltransferase